MIVAAAKGSVLVWAHLGNEVSKVEDSHEEDWGPGANGVILNL